ncbi:MAG: putative baseplate assembly protein, partial [Halobacteriota archaeon]
MALKVPSCDDTTYAAIVEDAKKQIPVYAKEWTDHNVHDPGITFLELLSWIAESLIYQLDQIPEAYYVKFLRLAGCAPRTQRCASVRLTFTLPPDVSSTASEFVEIPAGTQVIVNDEPGSELTFETAYNAVITDVTLGRVISVHTSGVDDDSKKNESHGLAFLAFGPEAQKGSCMYLAFSKQPFHNGAFAITVRIHDENLQAETAHDEAETHDNFSRGSQSSHCGGAPAWRTDCPDVAFKPSVQITWQYCTDPITWQSDGAWIDLDVADDETNALYQSGTIVLTLGKNDPSTVKSGTLFDYDGCWIRCKVIEDGYEIPPLVDNVALNTVLAVHRATVVNEELKRKPDELAFKDDTISSGLPHQTFLFSHDDHKPILFAEIQVNGTTWIERADFDGSGPDDPHYALNRTRGEILFGDGIRGKVPPPLQKVQAVRYCYGGGRRGNVRAHNTTWRLADGTPWKGAISNPFEGTGGADEEPYTSALNRLLKDMQIPYTAVTLADYVYIAKHTPGLRFGRATASVPACGITGTEGAESEVPSVEVIVVPDSPLDKPEPSQGFRDAVAAHLERHRLIATRLHVRGPRYVGIGVSVSTTIQSGYSEESRRRAIVDAIKRFLHPLRGFKGDGWPFGRTVYRSEIADIIAAVEGVECPITFSLTAV